MPRQQISVLLLDRDGGVLSTLAASEWVDAALRRRQYLAQQDGTDVAIARAILSRKFEFQLNTIITHDRILPGAQRAYDLVKAAVAWFNLPDVPPWLSTMGHLRLYEAKIALAYFQAWKDWRLTWYKADIHKVPSHWLTCGTRNSPISSGQTARWAIDPVHACLNYAYGVLEGQCRQALSSQGFDVACGFLHADKPGRDSLVYDLMQCERGTVDGLVLKFLSRRTMHYGDMTRVNDGSCRLHPQITRAVAAACRIEQYQIDTHALWFRDALLAPLSDQPKVKVNTTTFRHRKRTTRRRKEVVVPVW
ncbi:MAG: CRISPR-associated endonuclease Cas1 [Ktedonobacterales bacterium]